MDAATAASDVGRADKRRETKRYWIPSIAVSPMVHGFRHWDTEVSFDISSSMPWLGNLTPAYAVGQESCQSCATWESNVELKVLLGDFNFGYFPFDRHTLSFQVRVPGAHLTTCNGTSGGSSIPDLLTEMGIYEGHTWCTATPCTFPSVHC